MSKSNAPAAVSIPTLVGRCRRGLIHGESEPAVLIGLVRELGEEGGYPLVWLILLAEAALPPRVAAVHAQTPAMLAQAPAVGSELEPRALGPALREGLARLDLDFASEPELLPWRAAAAVGGLAWANLFPLRGAGRVLGVLGLAMPDRDRLLAEAEAAWLQELADDTAASLLRLRRSVSATAEEAERNAQLRQSLEKTVGQLNEAQRLARVGSWELNLRNGKLNWSDEIFRIFELDAKSFVPSYEGFLAAVHPEDRDKVNRAYQAALDGKNDYEITHRLLMSDGRVKYVRERGETEYDAAGRAILSRGTVQDITEHTLAEQALSASRAFTQAIFENAAVGLAMVGLDGSFRKVNRRFCEITGYAEAELIGKTFQAITHPDDVDRDWAQVERLLAGAADSYAMEKRYLRKDGEIVWVGLWVHVVRDEAGKPQFFVSAVSDISERKRHQAELEYIAQHDALTGLPNRLLLTDRLRHAMAQAQRLGKVLALAYIDLDAFKQINDRHGHAVGDRLLKALAERMRQTLRESDTLARLGGDEFVLVLQDLERQEDFLPSVRRLMQAVTEPVWIGELELQVTLSVGLSFYPQAEEVDSDQLLRQADQAMYQAKQAGKNRYHLFDAEQERAIRGRYETMERIRQALERGELTLYYQPKVNMRTGALIGVEALLRWQHPEQGLLAPAHFMPVIEDTPVAVAVGKWVLETALAQQAAWRRAGLEIPVSVNVSAIHLQQPDFMSHLQATLARHPELGPGALQFEVLESRALDDIALVSRTIEACRRIDVSFALDDFGTGYSSLSYLKRLNAELLKIDQSFVRDVLEDPDDMAILEGVIGLAGAFRCQVIAEGVELEAHGVRLLQLGCEWGQGHAIAHPMPAAAIPDWIESWRPPASWLDCQPVGVEARRLLFLLAEHRAWMASLVRCVQEPAASAPDPADGGVRGWLEHCRAHAVFPEALLTPIEALYLALCQGAVRLLANLPGADAARIREDLDALHALSQRFVDALQALLGSAPAATMAPRPV